MGGGSTREGERDGPNESLESEKPRCKMPARTKEQVFGGLRFQAEGTDGITGMLTFTDDKGGSVRGRDVVLRLNMHRRLRHYEPCDDDNYEMAFAAITGHISITLLLILTYKGLV